VRKAAIGVGSNQGYPVRICRDVFDLLQKHPAPSIFKALALYRTSPVRVMEQERFINAAVEMEYDRVHPAFGLAVRETLNRALELDYQQ